MKNKKFEFKRKETANIHYIKFYESKSKFEEYYISKIMIIHYKYTYITQKTFFHTKKIKLMINEQPL